MENLSTGIVDKKQSQRGYVGYVENLSTVNVEILTGKCGDRNTAELSTEDVDNMVEKCVEVISHLTTR